ncbi:MAG: EAL domain-containing protein [Bacteroides sp.]|nr:EAL domain-containing protein [Eubacterium sp.]MCM1418960.1 EAL domain-containing protein [Roseburia sp.]MCM1463104.1 EAL domain-containing protein [Bacteroides sp.]
MSNRNKNRQGKFFGLKCVLLAAAVLLIAFGIIYGEISPVFRDSILHMVIDLVALVFIAVVMTFEVRPYLQSKNVGVRNIYREKDIELEKFGKFNRMVEKNTFRYNFQPIIDAKTGDIFAYEALMRSPEDVGLSPREILKYAEISQQLYAIEYYTFYNTLRAYYENQESFAGRKMFINSIPSVFLNENDLAEMTALYGDITSNTVVEILEDDEDTDESCRYFESLRERFGCLIAIDDYGSGYASEMKLINNNPNFIKIDIMLIRSIDSDLKKQLLVSNIIKFASQYGIRVLAEGVETKEELQTLLELGVDLLQGFYLARPNAEILPELRPELRDYIIGENIRRAQFDNDRKIYTAEDGETVSVLELAVGKYGRVHLERGTLTVVGEPKHPVELTFSTGAGEECTIRFKDVNISGLNGSCVEIGARGSLRLELEGENTLNRDGIRVPEGAALKLVGDGDLTINASRNDGVGIGSGFSDVFGDITIETGGRLTIKSSGDRVVCIGGGKQTDGTAIRLLGGTISVGGRGIQAVGIGCGSGTLCFTSAVALTVDVSGNDVTGIGCSTGFADIEIVGGNVRVNAEGDRVAGIGVHDGKDLKITLSGGKIESSVRGKEAVCIGSYSGTANIAANGAEFINAYGEGTSVIGIGSGCSGIDESEITPSDGSLMISGGTVRSYVLSAEFVWFGTRERNIVITGGNVISNSTVPIVATNSFGEALAPLSVEGETYERRFTLNGVGYLYRAVKIPEADGFTVYIPAQYVEESAVAKALL